jgi:hypothetical protein
VRKEKPMKHIEKLKEALCEELDKFGKSGDITVNSLDKIHKITDTIKNIDKIMALEESDRYSETRSGRGGSYMHGSSYDDDMMYSERRGRGRNAKRDSMGRYAREGGYSEEDYSEEGGMSYERGSSYARGGRGYSRTEAKDHLMNSLGMMMEDADPKEREALKECMRAIERA